MNAVQVVSTVAYGLMYGAAVSAVSFTVLGVVRLVRLVRTVRGKLQGAPPPAPEKLTDPPTRAPRPKAGAR